MIVTTVQFPDIPRFSKKNRMKIEEEHRLIALAQSGCMKSRDKIILAHDGIIHAYLRRCKFVGNYTAEDAYSDGVLGLVRAIEKFDLSTGNRFSTYGSQWVKATIYRQLIYQDKTITLPANYVTDRKLEKCQPVFADSIDNILNEDGDTFHDYHADEQGLDWLADIEYHDLHTALHEALEWIDAEDADVLRLYYFEGLTQLQIKDRLGISEGSVKNSLKTGIAGMKHVMRKLSGITNFSSDF